MKIALNVANAKPACSVVGDVATLPTAARRARGSWPVALVSMPFVSASRPSLQLGLLKPLAESHGFPARTLHLNLDFAKQIGVELYELLCEHRGLQLGDWLFSIAAFGDAAPTPPTR